MTLPKPLIAIAGPMLIATSVLIVLHDYAFVGEATLQSGDYLRFFLPRHCFLGQSVAAGVLPTWNPYMMGGTPFLADPLSGWTYLLPMLLNASLPCDIALRTLTVLNPMIAGFGLYAFCRSERLGRVPATLGGLVVAMILSGSLTVQKLHFSGSIAWTAVALFCTSRTVRSEQWAARITWATFSALALSQVAAAFLSAGLALAGGALLAYCIGVVPSLRREGGRALLHALAGVGLIVLVFPLVDMAFLLPSFSFLNHTILANGYEGLTELSREVGLPVRVLRNRNPMPLTWPLRYGLSPGGYAGAAALLVFAGGLFVGRLRGMTLAFLAYGVVFAVLASGPGSEFVAPRVEGLPMGDVYAHAAHRFSHAMTLALPVLAAIGMEAWVRCEPHRRWLLVAPGVALWLLVMPLLGASISEMRLLIWGAVTSLILFIVVAIRPKLLPVLALALTVELIVNGISGQAIASSRVPTAFTGRDRPWRLDALLPLPEPDIDIGRWARGNPVVRKVAEEGGGRLINIATGVSAAAQLLDVETVEGYSSLQLTRYWSFVRALRGRKVSYNSSVFKEVRPVVVDALQTEWVIADRAPQDIAVTPVLSEEGSSGAGTSQPPILWRILDAPPRAEVVDSWEVAPGSSPLFRVTRPEWSPTDPVILERDPGFAPPSEEIAAAAVDATYRPQGVTGAVVEVSVDRPSVMVVRNTFHPGWEATSNGRRLRVIPANHLDQAVILPPGDHDILLTYREPSIGTGLAVSIGSLIVLFASAIALRFRRPRARAGSD